MTAVTRRTVVRGALGLAAAAALPRAYAKFGTTPLTSGFTLLTVLNKTGFELKSFADSTGEIAGV